MCFPENTVKFYCDNHVFYRSGPHNYGNEVKLARYWKGCPDHERDDLRNVMFVQTDDKQPCPNSKEREASEICPRCIAYRGFSSHHIAIMESHMRVILSRWKVIGPVEDDSMKRLFDLVVKCKDVLYPADDSQTYDDPIDNYPEAPPTYEVMTEKANAQWRAHHRILIDRHIELWDDIIDAVERPGKKDRYKICLLFRQWVRVKMDAWRADIEVHREVIT